MAVSCKGIAAVLVLCLPLVWGQGQPTDPNYLVNLALDKKNNQPQQQQQPAAQQQGAVANCLDVDNDPKFPGPAGPHHCCPATPLEKCGLFFYGFKNVVPTFSVTELAGDEPISPPLIAQKDPKLQVFVGNSGPELLFAPNLTALTRPGGASPDLSQIFYFTGKPARLTLRMDAGVKPQFLANRCILLPIRSAQVTRNLGLATEQMCNLNPKDGGRVCPEAKPCVVFKTKL